MPESIVSEVAARLKSAVHALLYGPRIITIKLTWPDDPIATPVSFKVWDGAEIDAGYPYSQSRKSGEENLCLRGFELAKPGDPEKFMVKRAGR